MGWIFSYQKPKDVRAYLDAELSDGDLRVVHSALVGKVYYAAVEIGKGAKSVAAFVALTAQKKGEFGFKMMDETWLPHYFQCPKSVFSKLTPIDNPYALEWREKVSRYHKMRELPSGTTLKLGNPMVFSDWVSESTFVLLRNGRVVRFRRAGDQRLVQISNWATRDFEVVGPAPN